MTALAPGMTDREPINGWEAVHPARNKDTGLHEAEIDEAVAWDRYERAVDSYYDHHYGSTEHRTQLDQLREDALAATKRKGEIYNRLNCEHYWVEDSTGGMQFSGGDVIDTTVEHVYCARCGLEQTQGE